MDVFKTLLLDTPDSLNAITGTLQIANGGTGATSAAGARDNLLPDYTSNAGKVLTVNPGATDVEWTTNGAGTVTSVDLSAGTGISVTGGPITSSGSITVTNTAPDQTVVLTAGTGISVTGTYPSFTLTNSSPSLGGDVVGPASATDNAIVRFDSTTGKLVQNSGVTISDANLLTTTDLTVNDNTTLGSSNTDTVNFNARVASDINPATDDTYDLGVTGHEWRNLNIDGTANIDSLVADTADINGGTIDGTAIGGSTAAAGAFTTLDSSSTTTLNGTTIPASSTLLVSGGALGTPSSGTVTNLTGTASININGTVGATTPSTGAFTTLSATGQLSGKGTATNDDAAAGYIGEYVSSSIAQANAISAVNNTGVNITSISLTAGDWDVDGMVYYLPDGSTSWDLFLASVSTTSASHPSRDTGGQGILKVSGGFGTGISSGLYAPMRRISISSTTTVYLVGTISFGAGSPTLYGTIRARRMR